MSDDLLQGLKDALSENNGQDQESDPMAAMEKLLKAIENMPGLTEEDKSKLQESLSGGAFGSGLPLVGPISSPWIEFSVLFGLVGFVALLLGCLGYKLYNNAIERERRRELKKQQKEQKKKK